MMEIKTVTVIGSGTMGNGICHVFAQNGFTVSLMDINQGALDKAIAVINKNMDRQVAKGSLSEADKMSAMGRIKTSTDMATAVAGSNLVIEAATEQIELKLKIFRQLDELCAPDCILATNTSSISITKIGAATKRAGKVIGMHFMNPVPVMKLVEVINGYATDTEVTDAVCALAVQLGKVPCKANDYPGFVANRVLIPMINEAIITLQEGVAGITEIDTIMKLGMGHPMGPLQLADFIGLDVCLSILNVLYAGYGNPKYAPSALLVNMVQAGYLGVKSGEGFYVYNHGTKDLIVSSRFAK